MKNIILAVLTVFSATFVANAATTAEMADSAYNSERYLEAITLYEKALSEDGTSAAVFYNLGNAYYRTDSPGRAILNYERSLRLDPTGTDARANLEFVRKGIEGLPEDDSSFLSNLSDRICYSMHPDTWAAFALGCFILILGAAALYIFSGNVTLRKTGFFGGIIMVVIFIFVFIFTFKSRTETGSDTEAIVIVPTTHLSSSPRSVKSQDDKFVTLPEGTKVQIIDSLMTPDDPESPKWFNVKINNSTKAWLKAADVERI